MTHEPFRYGIKKRVNLPVDEAERAVRDALEGEGFGVLTEIDVASTFREKLGVEFAPYRILGACNPTLAHQALSEDVDIGLLLPCNVVVYQGESEGDSVVAVLDPEAQLAVSGRKDIEPLARDVRDRMERVLESISPRAPRA